MRNSMMLLVLILALLGAMAATPLLVPVPGVRTGSAPGQFNVVRARDRLARILGDQRPHPADSPANDAVRERLLAELRAIGLSPEVRDQIACNEIYKARGVVCARVRNVVATIGPPSGHRLLLNAHYDSTAVGPGAGDDGAGVATLVEVAAILRNAPLKRPITFLFNEGEELGLVGARAFLADPLSRDVDSLINLEARGVTGPVNMFETSVPNGAPVAAFARAVDRPVANSLATDVYRLMPNYTDVNSFEERGWMTLNFAMIGNETRYHSPGDNLAALDPRSLQHMGDQALAVTRELSMGEAPKATGNRIFMDVLSRWLIQLPQTVGMALLAALLIGLAWLAWRRKAIGRGLAVIAGGLVLGTALAWLGSAAVGLARPGTFWRAFPLWTHLAVYASGLAAGVAMVAVVGRPMEVRQLRSAYWLAFVVLGALVAFVAPRGIIYFLFPPLVFGLGVVASRWQPRAEQAGSWLAAILLYLTLGAMVGELQELLNAGPMWLFAPLSLLVTMPVFIEAKQLVDSPPRRLIGIAALPFVLGWAAAAAAPAYSEDRQQQFTIEHVTDAGTGRSQWSVLNDFAPLPDRYGAAGPWQLAKLPYSDRKRWLTNAPAVGGLQAPEVQIVGRSAAGGTRHVTIRLKANGAETVALVAPEDAHLVAAGLGAFVRPIGKEAKDGRYVVRCFGRSCDGMTMDVVIGKAGPVDCIVLGLRAGLPPSAEPLLAARPKFARPQYAPDATITMSRLRL